MFKVAKHVALAIEQPDQKVNFTKNVVDVNNTEKYKFNSHSQVPKKEKKTFSSVNKNHLDEKGKIEFEKLRNHLV